MAGLLTDKHRKASAALVRLAQPESFLPQPVIKRRAASNDVSGFKRSVTVYQRP